MSEVFKSLVDKVISHGVFILILQAMCTEVKQ